MSDFNVKGLERIGRWNKGASGFDYSIDKKWTKLPVVYVFVDPNDQVLYVGKTVLSLEVALNRIKSGYAAQETNHRNHNQLVEHLQKGHSAEIFACASSKAHTDPTSFFDELKTELLQQISPL